MAPMLRVPLTTPKVAPGKDLRVHVVAQVDPHRWLEDDRRLDADLCVDDPAVLDPEHIELAPHARECQSQPEKPPGSALPPTTRATA